jgi:hypothetical protein
MDNSNLYSGFRYPAEIISHTVWLYFRFSLSFRDVEELLASRGVIVTYETVRQWTLKFGQLYANALRRKQAKHGDKWHLDEVVLTIKGKHPLPVAGGWPERAHTRYSDAESARSACSKTVLLQAVQGAVLLSARADYG